MATKNRKRFKARQGRPKASTCIRSYQQVADIMTERGYPMSHTRVWELETNALYKLFTQLIDLREEVK